MRVHHHAHIDAKGIAEHHIRRLAAHSRQRGERLHGVRHFAAVLLHERLAAARMLFAFDRKNPVDWMIRSSSSGSIAAKSRAVRQRAKSSGVTRFTRLSVHCAERIVAISNCSALA